MKNRLDTYIPVISGILLVLLGGIALYEFINQANVASDALIGEHVEILQDIFKRIDKTCTIVGLADRQNYIDFLTVRSFVSSEVGSLQLLNPDRWEGPYLQENLSVQGKLYELIQTREGIYIVPGRGVRLSNKNIIGKDIVFTYDTDVEKYINETEGLEYNSKPLARRIDSHVAAQALATAGVLVPGGD